MMFDISGRAQQSMVPGGSGDDRILSRSPGGRASVDRSEMEVIGSVLDRSKDPKSRLGKDGGKDSTNAEMEMMKERFAKLLLGEDMSGGGKGVSSALALSNAITNLAASVFGEQYRLEPMSIERKTRWRREIEWLLSVTDHIVELVPSQQTSKDGTTMEIMATQQRKDLLMNIPALRKLDRMLIGYLDNFKDQNEFWYASKDGDEETSKRKDDKWWLPIVKVPQGGLSAITKSWLLYQKELVNQVLKAAMAINAQVLMEMAIPDVYIDSLPKNGRACLGDGIYKCITDDVFDPEQFLSYLDLSTEHKVVDLKNRIEASIVIWKKKMHNRDGKSSWGSAVSLGKREQFEERAETILLLLKQRFPGISQSVLDVSKLQYNKDVGQSILESYSRVLESLAFTITSRIEDVLHANALAQGTGSRQCSTIPCDSKRSSVPLKRLDPKEEMEKLNSVGTTSSMTLSDFIDLHVDRQDAGNASSGAKFKNKPPSIEVGKRPSYMEKLEILGSLRSPISRH